MIAIKRVYEKASPKDGLRILVDRLWPRGLSKENAGVSLWVKEVAPSTELRRWFGHDPARWQQFQERYRTELKEHSDDLDRLRQKIKEGTVTLVYAARDAEHNNAVALKKILEGRKR
jgi:uncharacterized protein YeaO (DUF488 family)